jgi:hypothetical protein
MQLVAGTSISGYQGDGGPASVARIDGRIPWVDPTSGDVYLPEYNTNHRIRLINQAVGIITTFGGNGATSTAGVGGPISDVNFHTPWCVVGDAAATAL